MIMMYCFAHELSASRYIFDHSISSLGRYEDNVNFSDVELEKKEVSAGVIDINASLSKATSVSETNLFVNLNSASYSNSVYNIDTQNLGFFYNRRLENGNWSFRGSEANRSDREINLALGGNDLPNEDYKVDTQVLSFNFQRNITDRQNISFDASFQSNDYEYPTRSDYDYWSSSTLWQFVLNERLRLQGRVSYSDYSQEEQEGEIFTIFDYVPIQPNEEEETKQLCRQGDLDQFTSRFRYPPCGYFQKSSFSQKNSSLQIGTFFIWNELVSFDSLIGISKINNLRIQDIYLFPIEVENYTDYGYESEETLTTYQFNLYHEMETSNLTLSASSSNRVGGDGEISPTIEYSLNNKWRLSEKQSLVSELGYLDRSLYNTTQGAKVQTKKVMISYSYDISSSWLIDISYLYMERLKPIPNEFSASNNRVMFSIKWMPKKITI